MHKNSKLWIYRLRIREEHSSAPGDSLSSIQHQLCQAVRLPVLRKSPVKMLHILFILPQLRKPLKIHIS